MTSPTLSISRDALRKALTGVAGVIDPGKKAIPVARHVLLRAHENTLTLTATNFDAFVQIAVSCEASGSASALVPAQRLAEIVANLPPALVTIELGTRTRVVAGKSRFELTGLDPDEMPSFPAIRGTGGTVKASAFLNALTRCAPMASDAESRPILNSVCLEMDAGELIAVATEGHGLARVSVGKSSVALEQFLVHRVDVPTLVKLFGGRDGDLSVSVEENRAWFSMDGIVAGVRLVSGPFANWRQVVAMKAKHTVVCDRIALVAAIRRVSLASAAELSETSGKKLPVNRIRFSLGDTLTLSATSEEGTAADEIALDSCVSQAPLEIEFNATLLTHALGALASNDVRLSFQSPSHAVHITNPDASDSTLALAMPLRIGS